MVVSEPGRTTRAAAVTTLAAMLLLATPGCVPEPGPTASPSTGASTGASATATASASPSADETSTTGLVLPDTCEQIYSPTMLATLTAEVPPSGDPGITMLATQNVDALEVLQSAEATLRCTWGPPSDRGMATNVTLVTAEQGAALDAAFRGAGFSAESLGEGTVYRISTEAITQDDVLVSSGETHYVGVGGWVATHWINVDPPGYTEDIVVTLWG